MSSSSISFVHCIVGLFSSLNLKNVFWLPWLIVSILNLGTNRIQTYNLHYIELEQYSQISDLLFLRSKHIWLGQKLLWDLIWIEIWSPDGLAFLFNHERAKIKEWLTYMWHQAPGSGWSCWSMRTAGWGCPLTSHMETWPQTGCRPRSSKGSLRQRETETRPCWRSCWFLLHLCENPGGYMCKLRWDCLKCNNY